MQRVRQSGSALIDLVLGAFVAMSMLALYLHIATAYVNGRTEHREGAKLAAGAAGLKAYLKSKGPGIISAGSATGFADPYAPQANELKTAKFLAPYMNMTTPLGGTLIFFVRRDSNNDLVGLACDSQSITRSGIPAPDVAARVMNSSAGVGLMTNTAAQSVLNGPGMANVASPISGAAVVCAWAFLPNPS